MISRLPRPSKRALLTQCTQRYRVQQPRRGLQRMARYAPGAHDDDLHLTGSNQRLVTMLERSTRNRSPGDSWRWYQALSDRHSREPSGTDHEVMNAVVSRAEANSARLQMSRANAIMLDALDVKHQHGLTMEQVDERCAMGRKVLDRMTQAGDVLSSAQINCLLRLFVANRDIMAATQIWQYMALSGVSRDVTNYNSFILCQLVAKEYDQAFALVGEMRASGIPPNSFTQCLIIRLHGLTGDLQAARRVFAFACTSTSTWADETDGYSANDDSVVYWETPKGDDFGLCGATVYAFNAMLDVFGMNGLVDDMQRFLGYMLGLDTAGADASSSSSSPLGPDAIAQMLLQDEKSSLRRIRHRRIAPNMDTFHTMIKWLAEYWDLEKAEQYVKLMHVYGIAPDVRTFRLMITETTALRDFNKCSDLARSMTADYNIEVPRGLAKVLEAAGKKVAEMEESIRISENQSTFSFQ